jgi:hypothetical protein
MDTTYNLSVYSTAALALLAVGGVVQAEIAFVPETKETRSRPVPAPPQVTPTVGGGPSGFLLGFQARF